MEEKNRCAYCKQVYIIPIVDYYSGKKYCCRECLHDAQKANVDISKRNRQEYDFARNQMKKIHTGELDKRLDECRKRGISYAELQKEKTLAKQWKE